ncbi:SDR family oxidoreductase [Nonomuraea sp. NPDC005650]|uniref:SDR family oxidoreductase n=1 Tax=Nonomuraea sp. NPDC005650 TaxID=3157045 RepID=UPI0033B10329
MDLDLIGTWEKPLAVITGAGGGIGRAIARRLGARYRLVLVDVRQDAVADLRGALTEEGYDVALATVADVGDRDSVERLVETVASSGTLGTLVHTAGLSPSMAAWTRIVHVNLVGTAHVLDAFLPLAHPGGSAICFASVAAYTFPASPQADALLDDPYAPDLMTRLGPVLEHIDADKSEFSYKVHAYGASKRGVIRMVERRVRDWAERGARIVSISPGTVLTPMGRREHEANPLATATANVTPLRRRGAPTDIAATVDFLASDLASYITGSDIRVDGGIVAARTQGV